MTDLATAAQQVTQSDPEIAVRLPFSAWHLILTCLGWGAYKDVAATVDNLHAQIGPQLSEHHARLVAEAELARRHASEQQSGPAATAESEPTRPKVH
jgi:hypothetical protein